MGCNNSTETKPQNGGNNAGSPNNGQNGNQERSDPYCHFCHKQIPLREYNAHTVQCDEREVTCWHSWCRQIVKQGQLNKHMEECAKQQKTICPKCGAHVLVIQLKEHRDSCELQKCEHCDEKLIGRILKYCPVKQLGKLDRLNCGPFANEELREKYGTDLRGAGPVAQTNLGVARMQHLWRWCKTKSVIEEIIFKLIHKEMDLKKEGFAIFKAHDRYAEAHVLAPKRSRSIMQQPTVANASDHYFPSNSSVPITHTHINRMIKDFSNGVLIPYPAAWRIFTDAMNHLNTLPNVQRLQPSAGARLVNGRWHQGGKIIIVGDLHGQMSDLLHILGENGMPSDSTFYVFNGDFVDRGQFGVEILLILFSLMLAYPKYVALNRGNHECDYMNEEYGFDVEVSTKYDRNVFRLIQRCFCALPLATLVGSGVFVVHGGIPRRKGITVEDLTRIQRFRQIPMPEHAQPEEDEIFQDLLWSDPWEHMGWQESDRGAGVQFGADVTEEFMKLNKIDLIVRSHEEFAKGYEEHHGGKLVTVFSASNYDGPDTNSGCFMLLSGDSSEPSYHTWNVAEDDFGHWTGMEEHMSLDQTLNTPTSLNMSFAKISEFKGTSFYGGNMFRKESFVGPGGIVQSPKHLKGKRTRDEVLRVLRERIYQRRHRLLAYFTKLDRTQKGTLWKIEWVETMRNVLNLDLPWFFLRRYIATEDEHHRINYSLFLSRFHNGLMKLWLKEWEQQMAYHIAMLQRTTHRIRHLHAAFSKTMVSYNEFCSVMRAIDYTLSDACLFQLFLFFDRDNSGFINGEQFLEEIDTANPVDRMAVKWDLDTMEALQNIVIKGRTQLPQVFKVSGQKDKRISREQFNQGMEMINRSLKKSIPLSQRDRIWDFIVKEKCRGVAECNIAVITMDQFLGSFSVFDVAKEDRFLTPSMSRVHSDDDLHHPGSGPITPNHCKVGNFADIPCVSHSMSGSKSPGSPTTRNERKKLLPTPPAE